MSADGKVALKTTGDAITLAVPLSKAQGGRYYLDAELRGLAAHGEFEQRGSRMVARVDKAKADELLRILSERFSVRAVSGQAAQGMGAARFSRALKNSDYGRSDSRRLTKADLEVLAGRVRLFGEDVKTRILTEDEAREALAQLRGRAPDWGVGAREFRESAEYKARIEKLRASAPVEITGEEIALGEDAKENVKIANRYGLNLRGTYVNKDTGKAIPVTRSSIGEIKNHDAKSRAHLQAIAAERDFRGAALASGRRRGSVRVV